MTVEDDACLEWGWGDSFGLFLGTTGAFTRQPFLTSTPIAWPWNSLILIVAGIKAPLMGWLIVWIQAFKWSFQKEWTIIRQLRNLITLNLKVLGGKSNLSPKLLSKQVWSQSLKILKARPNQVPCKPLGCLNADHQKDTAFEKCHFKTGLTVFLTGI